MILENPQICHILEENKIHIIRQCWMSKKCSGYEEANKIINGCEPREWIKYILKDSAGFKLEYIDYANWHLKND